MGSCFDESEIYGFHKQANIVLKLNNDINSNMPKKLIIMSRIK